MAAVGRGFDAVSYIYQSASRVLNCGRILLEQFTHFRFNSLHTTTLGLSRKLLVVYRLVQGRCIHV